MQNYFDKEWKCKTWSHDEEQGVSGLSLHCKKVRYWPQSSQKDCAKNLEIFQKILLSLWMMSRILISMDMIFFAGDKFAFNDHTNVPDDVRYIRKRKYGPKLIVWILISELGHSEPYFHLYKGVLNSEIYKDQCFARLIPLINSHSNSNILFWPDFSSCHYLKIVINELKANNVTYLPKKINPLNIP